MLGLDIAAVIALLFPEPASTAAGAARLASKLRYVSKVRQALNKFNPFKNAKSWWNKGRNTRIPNENRASWRDLMRDDMAQRGQSDAAFAAGRKPNLLGRPDQAFNPFRPASKGGPGSGPTPAVRQAFERPVRAIRDNPRTVAATAGIAGGAAGGRSSKKKVKEGYEYIFEAAPTGSGAEGGADIADAYVDGVSQKASPEELEQASNDANEIAIQGGLGASQSDIDKTDREAEKEAKRQTNIDINNPESMTSEQLFNSFDMMYEADPDLLSDLVDKYENLIDRETADAAWEEYSERKSYLYSDDFAKSYSSEYSQLYDRTEYLWTNFMSRVDSVPDSKSALGFRWVIDGGNPLTPEQYDTLIEWGSGMSRRGELQSSVILPEVRKQLDLALQKYMNLIESAYREFYIAIINAWNEPEFTDEELAEIDNLGGLVGAAAALGFVFTSIKSFIDWFNKQSPELQQELRDLMDTQAKTNDTFGTSDAATLATLSGDQEKKKKKKGDELAQMSPKTEAEIDAMLLRGLERGDYGTGPQIQKQIDSLRRNQRNKTPGGIPRANKNTSSGTVVAHYEPPKFLNNRERQPITEVGIPNQKRILREIKKPVVIDEGPTKFKVKPTGRKNKSVGSSMMNKVETPLTYKPVNNIWSKKDKARNIRASQERKNQVLELVGAAEHHWTYLTEDRRKKKQEKVNEMMSAEFDKSLELMYENYKKSIDGKAEKLVNKIRTKVKPEYPENPPEGIDLKTGMHPKYGKKYKHDKLDPHSAESMPPTGDPVIDANAKKAHDPVQKARKLKILRGKSTKEETNWSKVSNRIKKLTESDWSPVDTGRPTNSTTQTFEYGGEGGPRFTANGLGGQDVYPQTIDFFGDQIPTPSYSNLALQGYTPPLGKGVMKRDKDAEEFRKKQDENLQKIKDTLESLGTSWEEMRANNWAIVKPDGTSIMLEPITPGRGQLNWIDNSKITVGKKHRNAGPNQNPFKVRNPDGSITIEFSEIKSVKKFEIGERPSVNAQLDASQDYTVEIDADAFMGGRVDGESPDTPTFADTGPDAPSPFRGHGSQYGPPPPHAQFTPSTNPNITPEDEAFIDYMERYPNFVNSLFPGQAAAATSVINYARGNYSDITQSPGRSANQSILNIISRVHKPGQRGGSVTAALNPGQDPSEYNMDRAYPHGPLNAPMRNFLNQFNYEVTSDGPRITDTFNFNDNRNTGWLGNIRIKGPDGNAIKIQDIADRLADIGDRRARSMGLDPASDSFGGKIDFTIPWNEVPARIQNQLDPTATIIPTTKRERKLKNLKGKK